MKSSTLNDAGSKTILRLSSRCKVNWLGYEVLQSYSTSLIDKKPISTSKTKYLVGLFDG